MHLNRTLRLLLPITLGALVLGGCARERAKKEARARVFAPPPKDPVLVAAQQKISLQKFSTDLASQDRVNKMPFAEIAQRLQSLNFSAHYELSMQRDEVVKQQVLDAEVSQDADGNFRVAVEIKDGDRQHLVYADKVLYLKHNYGHWRASRDPTDERKRWREQAYRIWPSFYSLFAGHMSFSKGTPVTYQGRPALRFELSVKPQQELPAPMPKELTTDIPEDAGLARWRALAERTETWRSYDRDGQLGEPLDFEMTRK